MAIWIITAIAIRNNWELKQTDVDAAYLNSLHATAQRIQGTWPGGQGNTPEMSDLWAETVRT